MIQAKEISIHDIKGIQIGHGQDEKNATGCSVIIIPEGAICGVDIRGGGPASRETQLLDPVCSNQGIHALFLSGGSAYGLNCASGIMAYLEERKIGFQVGEHIVPIVVGSCIFDLACQNGTVRPDFQMGYDACLDSVKNVERNGNVGGGTGATVGKLFGNEYAMKSGLGCYALQIGDLQVGAIVIVNAIGDVYEIDSNHKLAGLLNKDKTAMIDSENVLVKQNVQTSPVSSNTTIAAIITNAKLDKAAMNKVARLSGNGMIRTIRPVNTSLDGDSVYALTTNKVEASSDVTGTIGAYVLGKAINIAVLECEGKYGFLSAKDMKG